nr:MAG TPA: hypothetical protein [Caudoviricetes sp.]
MKLYLYFIKIYHKIHIIYQFTTSFWPLILILHCPDKTILLLT